ncbi:MAG: SDR family NAD(P)-dependent oxidoreductase [Bacillus subtilis]|nr:SDR family NAD(P)-dependent oxidoreductase [Bacillus subtilis]
MNRRVVVVTGASSGIGLVTAKYLHQQGFTVYGLSRTLPKETVPFAYVTADLASGDAVEQAVKTISEKEKGIYALVNCAGMGISGAVEYTSDAEVKKIFDVNVFGLHRLTRALISAASKREERADRQRLLRRGRTRDPVPDVLFDDQSRPERLYRGTRRHGTASVWHPCQRGSPGRYEDRLHRRARKIADRSKTIFTASGSSPPWRGWKKTNKKARIR